MENRDHYWREFLRGFSLSARFVRSFAWNHKAACDAYRQAYEAGEITQGKYHGLICGFDSAIGEAA